MGLRQGAVDYLVKPVSAQALVEKAQGRAGRMTSTMSGSDTSLRSLRDRPFELLKELEKRSRAVAAGSAPETNAGREWWAWHFEWAAKLFWWPARRPARFWAIRRRSPRIPGAKNW